jgi:release factor glutamine methyltransferase
VSDSVRDALDAAVDALRAAGVEDPRLDAEVLLAAALGVGRAALIAEPGAELPAAAGRRFGEMVRRRLRREPVAYILGRRGFRRLELEVDARVLVPRPETELLVEAALELEPRSALDVGTGSGAIALALADELPACSVTATDTSAAALAVAGANAARLGLSERVRFCAGTLPPAEQVPAGGFDLLLANLPYVAESEWPGLQPEVTQWEPREALLAGPDGLDAYRALLTPPRGRTSDRYPGESATAGRGIAEIARALALEIGAGQGEAVAALARDAGFDSVEVRRDLAGWERLVIAHR